MGEFIARVAVSTGALRADKLYSYAVPDADIARAEPGRRVLVPFGRSNKSVVGLVLHIEAGSENKLKPLLQVIDETPVLSAQMIALLLYMRDKYFCTVFDVLSAVVPALGAVKPLVRYRISPEADALQIASAIKHAPVKRDIVAYIRAAKTAPTAAQIEKAISGLQVRAALSKLISDGIILTKQRAISAPRGVEVRMYALSGKAEDALERLLSLRKDEKKRAVFDFLSTHPETEEKELCYMTGVSVRTLRTLLASHVICVRTIRLYRRPQTLFTKVKEDIVFSQEQASVFREVAHMIDEEAPGAALIHGVTGSGKTMIYIGLIRHVLKKGKGAILLVPEIALTPQLLGRLYAHFPKEVAVLHSALSQGERYDEWLRIKNGEARVVIGTRSAVLAPLENIGLIIIDEEQDAAYKSENTPKYHARDIARYRCAKQDAVLVLGSATPSVESYYHSETGRYRRLVLENRFFDAGLPEVIVSDMKTSLRDGYVGGIGPTLYEELSARINRGQQSILFINRRGNAKMISCMRCGYIPVCTKCTASLTYHSANERLLCHYCGHSEPVPARCPVCGGEHLKRTGFGTQRVERELLELFPGIAVIRMDSDTTTTKLSHEKLIARFAHGDAQILIGTQMVTKGLDFEKVTLVGVLDADLMLFSSDYRAGERTFSMIAQVLGRAGRRSERGLAIIQTAAPNHPIVQAAATQDYVSFYKSEIEVRKALLCPPICDIVVFSLSGTDDVRVLKAGMWLSSRIGALMRSRFPELNAPVLGPTPHPVHKVNDRFRYSVSFRAAETKGRKLLIYGILVEFSEERLNRGVALSADINPFM